MGKKSAWKAVADGLPEMRETYKYGPKTSRPVLVYESHRGEVTVARYEEHADKPRSSGWWIDTLPDWANIQDRESIMTGVTHWMEMPEPPVTASDAAQERR